MRNLPQAENPKNKCRLGQMQRLDFSKVELILKYRIGSVTKALLWSGQCLAVGTTCSSLGRRALFSPVRHSSSVKARNSSLTLSLKSPVRQSSSCGATNSPPFPKMHSAISKGNKQSEMANCGQCVFRRRRRTRQIITKTDERVAYLVSG